ncbi:MAG TPA: alanine racemase [Haliangiales bacterium]|nr:alanine racemase [Haliangiales bacterium]
MRRPDDLLTGPIRKTRAEIDLGTVVRNLHSVQSRVGDHVGILAVVKADAYGHGAIPVARALERAGVLGLAVSLAEEGIELRRAAIGGLIVVMGGAYDVAHREILSHGLVPVVSDLHDLHAFARAARSLGTRARIHVKIDTGMSRLGLRPAQVAAFLAAAAVTSDVEIVGVCTHLASAESDPAFTRQQLARFDAARRAFPPGIMVHAANSAATTELPASHYDAVRPGILLYRDAMRFVTAVSAVRDVVAGDPVSYGGLWRAPGPRRIATLPVGYADGYPRRLTGAGEVLVRGRRCPVVGAVCMDMTMIDVTEVPGVAVGDEAVLLGAQGQERISARELADRAGLIEYEITCGVSKRVPRFYFP